MSIDKCVHAHAFAEKKHFGVQRQRTGVSYIHHPEQVARIVKGWNGTEEQIEAAYLHDTVEDTDATLEVISEKFGDKVSSYVSELTNDKDEVQKKSKLVYMNEKLLNMSPEALLIKLADMYANMLDQPLEKTRDRMLANVAYLQKNRKDLLPVHIELIEEIEIAAMFI